MDDILREIDAALERRGTSARAASIRAQGAPEMIRDMRRGHVPSVERLRSLCEVLDLEFYVGPPRWRRVEDGGALPDLPLSALERSARDLVRLTLNAGGNPIPEDLWPTFLAMARRELVVEERKKTTAVELGLIPGAAGMLAGLWPTQTSPTLSDLRDRAIPLRGVQRTLAGRFIHERLPDEGSAPAGDREDQTGMSRGSLEEHGVNPDHCFIVEIQDESMEPTLPIGCVTMVDSESDDTDSSGIKVVQIGNDLMFRRVATNSEGQWLLMCDHPDWPNQPWPPGARIVGQVKWLGHWVD